MAFLSKYPRTPKFDGCPKNYEFLTCSICISGFRIFSIAFFIEADPVGMSLSRNSPFGSSCEHIIS